MRKDRQTAGIERREEFGKPRSCTPKRENATWRNRRVGAREGAGKESGATASASDALGFSSIKRPPFISARYRFSDLCAFNEFREHEVLGQSSGCARPFREAPPPTFIIRCRGRRIKRSIARAEFDRGAQFRAGPVRYRACRDFVIGACARVAFVAEPGAGHAPAEDESSGRSESDGRARGPGGRQGRRSRPAGAERP